MYECSCNVKVAFVVVGGHIACGTEAGSTRAERVVVEHVALDKELMSEGNEAIDARKFGTALAKFNAIIAQRPDFAEGWNKRATVYYLMGDYAHSLQDIDRTLELEPRHIGALSGLGLVNLRMEREEAAADAFERVLNIDPHSVSARNNLAIVQDMLKRNKI